jgi:hypothetical protein
MILLFAPDINMSGIYCRSQNKMTFDRSYNKEDTEYDIDICNIIAMEDKDIVEYLCRTQSPLIASGKGIDKDSIYFLLDRIFPMKKINYYGDMRKYNKHLLSCIEMQSDLVLISKNHIFKGTAKGSKLGTITRDDIKVDGILFECIFDKNGKNYIKFLLKESIKNPKSKRLIVDSVKMNMSMERLDILKKEVSE